MADLSSGPRRPIGLVRPEKLSGWRTAEPRSPQEALTLHRESAADAPPALADPPVHPNMSGSLSGGSSQAGLSAAHRLVRSVPSSPAPGENGSPFNPVVRERRAPAPESTDPQMITSRDVPKTPPETQEATAKASQKQRSPWHRTTQDQAVRETSRGPSNTITQDDEKHLPRNAYGAALLARVNAVMHTSGADSTRRPALPSNAPLSEPLDDRFEQPETPAAVGPEHEG